MPFKDKEAQREYMKRYFETEKGQAARLKYSQSEKGKATKRRNNMRYYSIIGENGERIKCKENANGERIYL